MLKLLLLSSPVRLLLDSVVLGLVGGSGKLFSLLTGDFSLLELLFLFGLAGSLFLSFDLGWVFLALVTSCFGAFAGLDLLWFFGGW